MRCERIRGLVACEQSPTASTGALQPPAVPGTIVVVIDGRIARADVPGLCERVRVVLEAGDADVVVCDVGALVEPDVGTVDALARLTLTARRLGCQVRLRDTSRELQQLLALAGLDDVVLRSAELRPGPRGQTEQRKQACGVEEEVESDDLIA